MPLATCFGKQNLYREIACFMATSAPQIPAATLKRRLDSSATSTSVSTIEPPSKKIHLSGDILFRVVVSHSEIGRVIGKKGIRIQQIRASTGASIKILDASIPNEDRVIVISSKDEGTGIMGSAKNALLAIARLILTAGKKEEDSTAISTIRLLISGSQADALIGSSGMKIENIRASSGATFNILAENQLPSCESVQEFDRLVQVSGNIFQVLHALQKLDFGLQNTPQKEGSSIRPQSEFDMHTTNMYTHILPYIPSQHQVYAHPQFQEYTPLTPQLPSVSDHVTFEMKIPENMVGGLIGKNGYNISMIRLESGATIKVSGEKGVEQQRSIQINGSSFQVSKARMMIENCMFLQLLPSKKNK